MSARRMDKNSRCCAPRLCVSPGWLDRILISPAAHQIHHSAMPEHSNRNGFAFSLSGFLSGKLYIPANDAPIVYGMGGAAIYHTSRACREGVLTTKDRTAPKLRRAPADADPAPTVRAGDEGRCQGGEGPPVMREHAGGDPRGHLQTRGAAGSGIVLTQEA